MATEIIFSNTRQIDVDQTEGSDLFLSLEGETGNANDLEFLLSSIEASNDSGGAFAVGLKDTDLVTRNLEAVNISASADATDGPDFAYGLQNVLLESERNNFGVNIDITSVGATSLSEDPTFVDEPDEPVNRDPAFGLTEQQLFCLSIMIVLLFNQVLQRAIG